MFGYAIAPPYKKHSVGGVHQYIFCPPHYCAGGLMYRASPRQNHLVNEGRQYSGLKKQTVVS